MAYASRSHAVKLSLLTAMMVSLPTGIAARDTGPVRGLRASGARSGRALDKASHSTPIPISTAGRGFRPIAGPIRATTSRVRLSRKNPSRSSLGESRSLISATVSAISARWAATSLSMVEGRLCSCCRITPAPSASLRSYRGGPAQGSFPVRARGLLRLNATARMGFPRRAKSLWQHQCALPGRFPEL